MSLSFNQYRVGWYCSNCNEYYDLKQIEFYLIEALHAKIMSYVTQDIKCQKCNEVRSISFTNRFIEYHYYSTYIIIFIGESWLFTALL